MIAAIRAEIRKLLTIQVWFWLLVGAAGLAAVIVIVPLAAGGSSIDNGTLHTIVTNGNLAFVAVFVLGVLSVTTEYRYQTITPTLLTTSNRLQLVGAKLITFVGVGLVFAIVIGIVQLAIAIPWLSAKGADITLLGATGAVTSVAEVAVVVVLYALLGVGFGALVRNQVVAVVVGLVYVLFLEGLLSIIPGVRVVYPYLPGGGAAAVYQAGLTRVVNDVTLLPPVLGAGVLVVWSVGLAGLGVFTSLRRDIT